MILEEYYAFLILIRKAHKIFVNKYSTLFIWEPKTLVNKLLKEHKKYLKQLTVILKR